MTGVTQSRQRELDQALDRQAVDATVGEQLFAVVDAVAGASAVRRALSDPAASDSAKAQLARSLFGGKIGAPALDVLVAATALRWNSGRAMLDALERQGVRAELKSAQAAGQLDAVTDDLFRFGRIVAGDPQLRDALGNPQVDRARKLALLDKLLAGKTAAPTLALARRSLSGRDGSMEESLASYGQTAAELRDRAVAKVTSATPLPADQLARLRAALMKQVGRELDVQLTVDPAVLGGLRVQVGDQIIDGTVERRLDQARRQIA